MAKKIKLIQAHGGRCQKCGISDLDRPWIYQFHHLDPNTKLFEIGTKGDFSYEKLYKESLKCICLCGNCHRELHHVDDSKYETFLNKELFLKYKNINSCEKCGYNKTIQSLEFHHIINKEYGISDLVVFTKNKINENIDLIYSELDKCKVLCSNCHRDEHANIEMFKKYKDEIYKKIASLKNNYNKRVDRDLIISLHIDGVGQSKIAKVVGCSESIVCETLKMNNINCDENSEIIDRVNIEYLIELNYSDEDISKILKRNKSVILAVRNKS
ncbi:MAG: hypothetical protein M0R17_00215 [Candidatus Omnitrophica bacterium]|nr:hypothetical protein [Candidatus Omnitrophota bacterium]